MKKKKWIRPVLFTLCGVIFGLSYYYVAGCRADSCTIASNPLFSALWMGVVGYLLSIVFPKKNADSEEKQ